jgi:hypothetical protein
MDISMQDENALSQLSCISALGPFYKHVEFMLGRSFLNSNRPRRSINRNIGWVGATTQFNQHNSLPKEHHLRKLSLLHEI